MVILMIGGVYCPLSPRDPQHRLEEVLQQTHCHLVLVHWLTKTSWNDDTVSLEIESILTNNDVHSVLDIDQLSNVVVMRESIAYIIFTSGSTGSPKGVSERFVKKFLFFYLWLLTGTSATLQFHKFYEFSNSC